MDLRYSYDRRAHAGQAEELASKLAEAVRLGLKTVVKNAVKQVAREDRDGALLGAVYHDSFDEAKFLQSLKVKLTDAPRAPHELAHGILEELGKYG